MMQSSPVRFPKAPLVGMWALVLFTLVAAFVVRLTGTESTRPTSRAVVVQDLRFEDMSDGGIAVYGGDKAAPMDIVAPGTNGFVRATLRGLARERKREGASHEAAFRLTGWSDGRLTLDDTATGRHVDLGAFGHTNAQAFARLLKSKEIAR